MEAISIRGARTHNLKNISADLPRNKLVVITGLSGSGKSSLAFDTLYAEGQRRYVESISAYARQFLQLMDKPDVDLITGLSPAIAIDQKNSGSNPRSTVGTITEIHDYLRLLYARTGTPYCPQHGVALQAYSVSQIVESALHDMPEARLAILAPRARACTDDLGAECRRLQSMGFVRVRLNQEIINLDGAGSPPEAPGPWDLDVVIDRLRVRADSRQRMAESLETALELGEGRVLLLDLDSGAELARSAVHSCALCSYTSAPLEPRMFSFNNPAGACPTCGGLGQQELFDPALVVAFPELSLAGGAIYGWDRRNAFSYATMLSLARHYGFDMDAPFQDLPATVREQILYGSGESAIEFSYPGGAGGVQKRSHPFEGVIPSLQRRWQDASSHAVREELARLRHTVRCSACHGTRLGVEARHVRLGQDLAADGLPGFTITQLEEMPLADCLQWFKNWQPQAALREVAERITQEIGARLGFLHDVGLGYLSLARSADTLSGGETQRIRLASQIGSGLTGVLYVLDEPSIGLHQRDNQRLIATLEHLRELGNTVVVVEHDEDMIRAADYVLDMGPGAGEMGGTIVASGSPAEIQSNPDSLTGQYLAGVRSIGRSPPRALDPEQKWLRISGCSGNNLADVDLALPVGRFSCITGVSGSGKSTLINDTLVAAMAHKLMRARASAAPYRSLQGLEFFDKLISVDQSPIGRTPRSNPATYTGLFTPIRELFATVPEARIRGYDPGRFSFNVRGGRCEACQGDGVTRVELHFLPDMYVPCELCQGRRYNRETLDIRYRGHNISEVLNFTVVQALEVFAAVPAIARKLQTLLDVGLGYIRLGQSAITLSGGEAQRIKLSQELSRRASERTLYVLDEPTTGLHFHDTAVLLQVLQRLVDGGSTVVVIEHNMEVIRAADWIVDLGPEGGAGGGHIVAQGPGAQIAACAASHTGKWLAAALEP